MATALAHAQTLRLSGAAVAPAPRPLPARNNAAEPQPDPRWVIAVAAARSLDGGRAAILTPTARERIIRLARTLGLRPFDANLIIAIVQDAARRGEPLGGELSRRLQVVPAAVDDQAITPARLLLMSAILGVCIFGLLLMSIA